MASDDVMNQSSNTAGQNSSDSFLEISLNIKQKNLPFILNPNTELYGNVTTKSNKSYRTTLSFSFRKKTAQKFYKENASTHATISICPKSFEKVVKKDISYKLLYEPTPNDTQPDHNNNKISLTDVFDEVPSIQIREYSINARLNLLVSIILGLWHGLTDGISDGEGTGVPLTKKLGAIYDTFKDVIGQGDPNSSIDNILTREFINFPNNANEKFKFNDVTVGAHQKEFVSLYNMIWCMYYEMITSYSMNVYELPFSGEFSFKSDGLNGWNGSGITGVSFGESSFVGQFANYFLKNIKLDFTPVWDGSSDKGTEFEAKVDLFNDDIDRMVDNFMFINTIIPGNMSILYHIFLHSPNLYDVKIKGLDRMFMCSGSFLYDYKGVIRRPPSKFFEKLKDRINDKLFDKGKFDKYLRSNDVIRIPDVYSLTLRFSSLLPNNFNNFVFRYCANENIESINTDKTIVNSSAAAAFSGVLRQVKARYDQNIAPAKAEIKQSLEQQLKEQQVGFQALLEAQKQITQKLTELAQQLQLEAKQAGGGAQ